MSDQILSTYEYFLPKELIADHPIMPKEAARLLVYHKDSQKIEHLYFSDFADILPKCDIVFNDTKVVKARIYGHKQSGGSVELLLNTPLDDGKFSVFIKGKVSVGSRLEFGENLSATIIKLQDDGERIVEFRQDDKLLQTAQIYEILHRIGHVPLPPYIKREDSFQDESWYQSIFADKNGAVAAPTASLHISPQMLDKLKQTHALYYLTLHVGSGTFKGVECEDILKHNMHGEIYSIPPQTQKIIDSNSPLLGVGTTVTRCIENYARDGKADGICKLFLNPFNKPIRQNYLLTNFHLPKSTLIMLVAAFIGTKETLRIYNEAVKARYRFYSYGDGMLII